MVPKVISEDREIKIPVPVKETKTVRIPRQRIVTEEEEVRKDHVTVSHLMRAQRVFTHAHASLFFFQSPAQIILRLLTKCIRAALIRGPGYGGDYAHRHCARGSCRHSLRFGPSDPTLFYLIRTHVLHPAARSRLSSSHHLHPDVFHIYPAVLNPAARRWLQPGAHLDLLPPISIGLCELNY